MSILLLRTYLYEIQRKTAEFASDVFFVVGYRLSMKYFFEILTKF